MKGAKALITFLSQFLNSIINHLEEGISRDVYSEIHLLNKEFLCSHSFKYTYNYVVN